MEKNPIENKLNLTYYTGEDQYSDGAVEDELLEAVQSSSDVLQILMEHQEWPFLYHLSPIRENLLEWFDFDPDGSVLEIGSGCGALTGLLCRRLRRVAGIELSKKRSLINAARNRDFDNLEILVGNFEDIRLKEKFDYVTLIGVLEYAASYLGGGRPYDSMLKRARSFLKEGGKLLLAIENKYGLKYWAGAAEDHTGVYFRGIENYGREDPARTFSRRTLERMLEEAGFRENHFYYPLPDYKLPTEIYSDSYLPGPGSVRNVSDSYDRERYQCFDEEKVFDSLCGDGLFPEFANSFLVISG